VGLAPKHQAYAGIHKQISHDWSVAPQIHVIQGRERAAGDPRDPSKGYMKMDLKVSHNYNNSTELGLIVKNVFDADIREPSSSDANFALSNDIPQRGRFIAVEARHQL
jgi:outer membrane receptor for ferrienterochelin and colicin